MGKDSLTLELWSPDGITTRYDNLDDEIRNLKYGSRSPGGFSACSWEMYRSPQRLFDDIGITNTVRIYHGPRLVWHGQIVSVQRTIGDEVTLAVQADGFSGRLKTRLTTTGVAAGQKGSDWITGVLLADADLDFDAGVINTADFAFPYGVDMSPHITFEEGLNRINKANGYYWGITGVTPGTFRPVFDWYPKPEAPDLYVSIEESDSDLAYSVDDVINFVRYAYTIDGSTYQYGYVQDAASQGRWRRRDGEIALQGKANSATAIQVATVFLNERKLLKPQTSFTCRTVHDAAGAVIPVFEVLAGPVLRIPDLFPAEMIIADAETVNEMSTFEVVEAVVDVDAGCVTVAPGRTGLALEKMLAYLDALQPPNRS
ncbi:hypothetical protein KKB44_06720 [Candidatus Micrarchaeota archaeon]|nr:hypothetical protein [Candidatus Micrarchaeota archaeon]